MYFPTLKQEQLSSRKRDKDMTAREMIKESLGDTSSLKGSISLPLEFEKISMLAGISADEALDGVIGKIKEEHKVIPQYRSFKEKLGGGLFGFYINHSVDQQNNFNENMAAVCEEFDRLSKEKAELMKKINDVSVRIMKLEKQRCR